ncbi:acyltransferase family protein [Egibacter rhizosphaerae]|nr:acyltransferase [Egibacter rhizosphaerae]
MIARLDALADSIERRTPEGRDRYLDFLRVAAIAAVVLGHWLVRVVTVEDGRLESDYLLAAVPATQWATWWVQVMPLFFIVGGWSNLRSWRSARARGERLVAWIRSRARRLLRPLVPLLVVWVTVAAVLESWRGQDALVFGAETAIIPAWFLAAYLLVTALTPVLARRHEADGGSRVLAGLAAAAVLIDGLRFAGPDWATGLPTVEGEPLFAALNYLFVWLAVHQLGFWWADGRVPTRRSRQVLLAAGAIAFLALLVGFGGYPRSMVSVPGAELSNSAPPTVALLVLGIAQLAAAAAARPGLERWLARPRVWAVVVLAGSRLMAVFLWHQTAMLVVAAVAYPTGLWSAGERIDAEWWLSRPAWIAACAIVLALLVAVVGRWETAGPASDSVLPGRVAAVKTVAALLLTSIGLGVLIVGGLTDPDGPLGLPAGPLAALLAGLFGMGVVGQSWRARLAPAVSAGGRDRQFLER